MSGGSVCSIGGSGFAAVRVRPAHRDTLRSEPRPEEWFMVEWPEDMPLADLVEITKLRWRIERDFQDLKQELGLGHYEGRGWRGFHHHAALCIAADGFLNTERGLIPPLGTTLRPAPRISPSGLSAM